MTEQNFSGGCLCGAVRYLAVGEPLLVEYCHCGMCRRASGAPVVAWATFPRATLSWQSGHPTLRASSAKAQRGFCQECGSQLIFQWGDQTPRISVTVATLDDPEALKPTYHIYTGDQLSWLNIEDDLPRHPEKLPG